MRKFAQEGGQCKYLLRDTLCIDYIPGGYRYMHRCCPDVTCKLTNGQATRGTRTQQQGSPGDHRSPICRFPLATNSMRRKSITA